MVTFRLSLGDQGLNFLVSVPGMGLLNDGL
jgi:hypothetical protein